MRQFKKILQMQRKVWYISILRIMTIKQNAMILLALKSEMVLKPVLNGWAFFMGEINPHQAKKRQNLLKQIKA